MGSWARVRVSTVKPYCKRWEAGWGLGLVRLSHTARDGKLGEGLGMRLSLTHVTFLEGEMVWLNRLMYFFNQTPLFFFCCSLLCVYYSRMVFIPFQLCNYYLRVATMQGRRLFEFCATGVVPKQWPPSSLWFACSMQVCKYAQDTIKGSMRIVKYYRHHPLCAQCLNIKLGYNTTGITCATLTLSDGSQGSFSAYWKWSKAGTRLMTWRRLPLMVPFDGSPEQSSHRLSSEKFDWSGQCQGRLTQRKPQKLSSLMYSAWEPVTRPPPSICTCAYQKWSKAGMNL